MYHIYNRANGSERLFVSDENYLFFLRQYLKYIVPIIETWCYCLMPNHFHFLLKIRSEEEIEKIIEDWRYKSSITLQGFETLEGLAKQEAISKFLTQQFSHLFNAYAQSFNKEHSRRGSLFMHPYKRKQVTDVKYLIKLIHYIHYNPVEAGLSGKPEDWKFSSYQAIISDKPTMINRKEVITFFDDRENFMHCHQTPPIRSGVE